MVQSPPRKEAPPATEAPEPQEVPSPTPQEEVSAAEQEPDAEVKMEDGGKEVTSQPSTESMDVEIVGVTAAVKSEDYVKLDDDDDEKDKKSESEDTGKYCGTVIVRCIKYQYLLFGVAQ